MAAVGDLEPFSTIRLRDGRILAHLEVGKKDGPVVIHCHGSGSSRLEAWLMADAANEVGIRLIALDRPGVGRPDPHRYLNVAGWTDDVAELADQLGLEEFAVQGMSNAGPYALACAYKFPHTLRACGLISTASPREVVRKAGPAWMRFVWWIGQQYPRAFRSYVGWMIPDTPLRETDKRLRRMIRWMSKPDRRALEDSSLRAFLVRTLSEQPHTGAIGGRYEAEVGMCPWGFALDAVRIERLLLWHGELDRLIAADQARALAAALPHCTATSFPDEGHLSVIANRAREILALLK
jgi:pimeloyl-ACP methyl ester carboxylesterase